MSERESSASCIMCRINRNTGILGRTLKYRHEGILVDVEIKAGECDQCAIARSRGYFERVEEAVKLGILDTANDGWRVDWKLFNTVRVYPEKYEPNFYYRLANLLVDLKFMTAQLSSGVYAIVRDYGMVQNPYNERGLPLYFIHSKDAAGFMKTCYMNDTQYEWHIVKFEVIKKEDALK